MTRQLSTVEVGIGLSDLHEEFSCLKDLDGFWYANFGNASRDVAHTIIRSDSDIHESLLLEVYKELKSFEDLVNLSYWDTDLMTTYGLMVTKVRFCLGYGGNLKEGHVINRAQALALIFAYEAYWKFGEDFTFGNNVESHLRKLGPPESWGWPSNKDFKYREERRQYQWLAYTVLSELQKLARHHRIMAPGMEMIRTADVPKPEFRDFRAVHAQIQAMATSLAKDAKKLKQAA